MINPHDHQVYAVKELTNLTLEDGSTDEVAMHELLAEVRKMGVVESEFIVQYRTSAVFGGRFYVMMEPIASWRSLSQLASLLHDSGIVSRRSTRETFTAEIAAMVRQLLGSSHARRQIASVGFPGDCCRLASRV